MMHLFLRVVSCASEPAPRHCVTCDVDLPSDAVADVDDEAGVSFLKEELDYHCETCHHGENHEGLLARLDEETNVLDAAREAVEAFAVPHEFARDVTAEVVVDVGVFCLTETCDAYDFLATIRVRCTLRVHVMSEHILGIGALRFKVLRVHNWMECDADTSLSTGLENVNDNEPEEAEAAVEEEAAAVRAREEAEIAHDLADLEEEEAIRDDMLRDLDHEFEQWTLQSAAAAATRPSRAKQQWDAFCRRVTLRGWTEPNVLYHHAHPDVTAAIAQARELRASKANDEFYDAELQSDEAAPKVVFSMLNMYKGQPQNLTNYPLRYRGMKLIPRYEFLLGQYCNERYRWYFLNYAFPYERNRSGGDTVQVHLVLEPATAARSWCTQQLPQIDLRACSAANLPPLRENAQGRYSMACEATFSHGSARQQRVHRVALNVAHVGNISLGQLHAQGVSTHWNNSRAPHAGAAPAGTSIWQRSTARRAATASAANAVRDSTLGSSRSAH